MSCIYVYILYCIYINYIYNILNTFSYSIHMNIRNKIFLSNYFDIENNFFNGYKFHYIINCSITNINIYQTLYCTVYNITLYCYITDNYMIPENNFVEIIFYVVYSIPYTNIIIHYT
jgi:hypothetical protein